MKINHKKRGGMDQKEDKKIEAPYRALNKKAKIKKDLYFFFRDRELSYGQRNFGFVDKQNSEIS